MKTGLKQGFKTTEKNLQEKGQVTTAQPTCDPTESRGEENRHRGGAGLQQRQTHLLPQEDRRAGADLGRETQGTHSRKECILSELIQSERNMPIFILFIFHWRIIAFHFQLKEFL